MRVEAVGGQQVQTQVSRAPQAQRVDTGEGAIAELGKAAVGAMQIKQRADIAEAEETLAKFEQEANGLLYAPETGYFNSKGRDAFEGRQSTLEQLQQLQQTYAKGLKSPAAQRAFARTADKLVNRRSADIDRHASQGLQTWEVAAAKSVVDNTVANATVMWSDPAKLREEALRGEGQLMQSLRLQGLDDGEIIKQELATYRSSFYAGAVDGALSSSYKEAQELFNKHTEYLVGGDRLRLEKALEAKKRQEESESKAAEVSLRAQQIVGENSDRADIIAAARNIEDKELSSLVLKEATYLFNQQQQARQELRLEAFDHAQEYVRTGGDPVAYAAQHPEYWDSLKSAEREKILNGDATRTNWTTFSNLMTLPTSELAKIDPTDYMSELSASHRGQLVTAVKAARNGTESVESQVGRTRASESKAAAIQLFGMPDTWKGKKQEQVNQFYAALDDAVRSYRPDGKLSSAEYTQVLSTLTQKVVKQGFFWDSEYDLSDIKPDRMAQIRQFLREQNKAITARNIINVNENWDKIFNGQ